MTPDDETGRPARDHGRPGPGSPAWDGGDWRAAREEWRRRRMREAGRNGAYGPPWARRHRGFGCVFGLLFLFVIGSLVAAMAIVISQLGPLPGLVALAVIVAVLIGMGRTLFLTARTLDRLVDATRRVEAGDYSVRVGAPARGSGGLPVVDQLTGGFDTMITRLETDETQRRTLLADISHELRTPLTVVQGNLEAIIDGVYPPDPAHIAVVLDETKILGRLIDDLRTLALSEAGTLALHVEPTDPDILVGDVVRSFEPAAAAAGVTLTATIDGDLPIVEVDPVRIREVLANLVANALRHTPDGGRITVAGSLEDGRRLRLEVRDTGSGIEPALLPHVFDRFAKGDDSVGSGLGLAIARGLVVAHGGEIHAASPTGEPPGGGTSMVVRLPLTGG
ncbi:MAG TPA: ATP-binding protein [Candidatus Limnocylindrales bacterium]|nr:ATP-binding protein [Candidatus Limnocylindrales bacterium]